MVESENTGQINMLNKYLQYGLGYFSYHGGFPHGI